MNDYKELIEILRDDEFCGKLDYIDDAADVIEQLVTDYEILAKMYAKVNEDLCVRTKERDAAVADLTDTAMHGECVACKYFDRSDNVFCQECRLHSDSRWEWRGHTEENSET